MIILLYLLIFQCFSLQAKQAYQRFIRQETQSGTNIVYDNNGTAQKIEYWAKCIKVPVVNNVADYINQEIYYTKGEVYVQNSPDKDFLQKVLVRQPNFDEQSYSILTTNHYVEDILQKNIPQKPIILPKINQVTCQISYDDMKQYYAEKFKSQSQSESCSANLETKKSGFIAGMNIKPSCFDPEDFMTLEQLYAKKIREFEYNHYCISNYNMTSEELGYFLNRYSVAHFVAGLLALENVSNSAVLELWKQYKNSCLDPFGWRTKEHDKTIKDELARRQNKQEDLLIKCIEDERLKHQKELEDKRQQCQQKEKTRQEVAAQQLAELQAVDAQNKAAAALEQAVKIKVEELRHAQHVKQIQEEQQVVQHEQAELEEQEALIFYESLIKNQYESCNFDLADCPEHELTKQWCERQKALSVTMEQDFKQFDQAFCLDVQTIGFLASHDIDYKNYQCFVGTALQQQLHGEMCNILSQAAILQKQFLSQSCLLTSVVEFADAAYETNKNEQVWLTSQLMDVDWIVLKLSREIATSALPYAKAVAFGAVHGVIDSLEMFADPIAIFKGLGKAIYFVLETAALNTAEDEFLIPESYALKGDQRNEEVWQAMKQLGHRMAESTGPERLEALVRFGTDFRVSGKIIHAVGGVCGVIRSQAKIMRTLEGIAPMLADELGFEKAMQEVIQATEKLEVATQENIGKQFVVELMETENNLDKSRKVISGSKVTPSLPVRCKVLTGTESVDKVKKYGYKIPVRNVELYHNTKYWIDQACAKVNTKIEAALLEECKKMQQIAGNTEMSVCMDLEHIVNVKYELIEDASKSFYIVDLKGGHLAGTMTKLEQEGLVQIESYIEFGGGCREYKVKDLWTGRGFKHTEFPPHWNVEKIAQETKSACENAIAEGLLTGQTKKPVEVMTHDGFELRIVTDPNSLVHDCIAIENTTNRHVITSHPIYKR